MIEAFKKVGYIDGVNMAGGGYLFHDIPRMEWVHDIINLVEQFYSKNGNSRVILICHSMGAPFSYFLLQTAGDEWVKKYIYKMIYISPAWMGSVKSLNFMFDGIDHTVPIAGKIFAPLSRHFPSAFFLLPWADAFKGLIMASSPSKNYTYDMIPDILKDVGLNDVDDKLQASLYGFIQKFDNYAKPPPVPVITYIGRGLKTPSQLVFKKDLKPLDPDGRWDHDGLLYDDGDGTVPWQSLKYPTEKWTKMGADVKTIYYDNGEHVKMLYDEKLIQSIIDEAC